MSQQLRPGIQSTVPRKQSRDRMCPFLAETRNCFLLQSGSDTRCSHTEDSLKEEASSLATDIPWALDWPGGVVLCLGAQHQQQRGWIDTEKLKLVAGYHGNRCQKEDLPPKVCETIREALPVYQKGSPESCYFISEWSAPLG